MKHMVQRALLQQPCCGDLWYVLTQVLLTYYPDLSHSASVTARNAILYQQNGQDLVGVLSKNIFEFVLCTNRRKSHITEFFCKILALRKC